MPNPKPIVASCRSSDFVVRGVRDAKSTSPHDLAFTKGTFINLETEVGYRYYGSCTVAFATGPSWGWFSKFDVEPMDRYGNRRPIGFSRSEITKRRVISEEMKREELEERGRQARMRVKEVPDWRAPADVPHSLLSPAAQSAARRATVAAVPVSRFVNEDNAETRTQSSRAASTVSLLPKGLPLAYNPNDRIRAPQAALRGTAHWRDRLTSTAAQLRGKGRERADSGSSLAIGTFLQGEPQDGDSEGSLKMQWVKTQRDCNPMVGNKTISIPAGTIVAVTATIRQTWCFGLILQAETSTLEWAFIHKDNAVKTLEWNTMKRLVWETYYSEFNCTPEFVRMSFARFSVSRGGEDAPPAYDELDVDEDAESMRFDPDRKEPIVDHEAV